MLHHILGVVVVGVDSVTIVRNIIVSTTTGTSGEGLVVIHVTLAPLKQTLPCNLDEIAGHEDACQKAQHNPSDEKEEADVRASARRINEWVQAGLDMLLC